MKPFFTRKRIYIFILIALACFTFFYQDPCDSTFSAGFLYPIFEIEPYSLTISYYNIFLSVIITLAFIGAGTVLVLMINIAKWWKVLSKVAISCMINIFLFDIVVFETHLRKLFKNFYVIYYIEEYYLLWPFIHMLNFFTKLRIELTEFGLISRIYFILSTGLIFLVIFLIDKIKNKLVSMKNNVDSISL